MTAFFLCLANEKFLQALLSHFDCTYDSTEENWDKIESKGHLQRLEMLQELKIFIGLLRSCLMVHQEQTKI